VKKLLAIADDLSGAAEIAGIGLRYGLPTRLVRGRLTRCGDGLTVVDTDSRLLTPQEASRVVRDAVAEIDPAEFERVYKKTDSAFRGQILAEVTTLLPLLRKSSALLVPHNPSRGRTVRHGEYQINGTLLHESSFANDPDHPATCSDVVQLLTRSNAGASCIETPSDLPASAIWIGAASTTSDVRLWADRVASHVLPVGGADFFAANLEALGLQPSAPFLNRINAATRLFVCGSASGYSRQLISLAQRNGISICEMPLDVFRGGDVSGWADSVSSQLRLHKRALIVITHGLDYSTGASQRLQASLAEVVAQVLEALPVDGLFLEGGATASAVCRRMGWEGLDVLGELDTGVVQARAGRPIAQMLVIKPGSYCWPEVAFTD
jgi:uncharacterized protein YgbK (DUF1537 family)